MPRRPFTWTQTADEILETRAAYSWRISKRAGVPGSGSAGLACADAGVTDHRVHGRSAGQLDRHPMIDVAVGQVQLPDPSAGSFQIGNDARLPVQDVMPCTQQRSTSPAPLPVRPHRQDRQVLMRPARVPPLQRRVKDREPRRPRISHRGHPLPIPLRRPCGTRTPDSHSADTDSYGDTATSSRSWQEFHLGPGAKSRGTSTSRNWSTAQSWADDTSWSDATATQRVYEYAIEPAVLQNLPDHALLLAAPGPVGPHLQAVECDPTIAALPSLTTRHLAPTPLSGTAQLPFVQQAWPASPAWQPGPARLPRTPLPQAPRRPPRPPPHLTSLCLRQATQRTPASAGTG
jgi:hypothetical protein